MTISIGIDDTDSRFGMCTTFLASEIIREFEDYDLIGLPRLVRLNPNIPWKTRGNGAICLRLGKGVGQSKPVCMIGDRAYGFYEDGTGSQNVEEFEPRVAEIIESFYMLDDENTNPAFVIMKEDPPESLYWRAVRGIVTLDEVRDLVEGKGTYRLYKNGRGLIGATSAIAWRPNDRTYEIITYRQRDKWGTEREIDEDSVVAMDKQFSSTFNNYDYDENHVVIAPNSPCPVLFGIRGDDPDDLLPAMSTIKGEHPERWTLFLTNQGTDDHLVERKVGEINEFESVITRANVISEPRTIFGGHLIFRISDGNEIDCAAYEPSKGFRNVVNDLRPGDVITVYGSIRMDPRRTVNVEKLRIDSLADVEEKAGNPRCPECGKRMKSIGSGVGYRCKRCHIKVDDDEAEIVAVQRMLSPGFYEPPVSARRHLSKPLKRMYPKPSS
jgi:tRNA(Ile2)-agmatinylcytidine synthase